MMKILHNKTNGDKQFIDHKSSSITSVFAEYLVKTRPKEFELLEVEELKEKSTEPKVENKPIVETTSIPTKEEEIKSEDAPKRRRRRKTTEQ